MYDREIACGPASFWLLSCLVRAFCRPVRPAGASGKLRALAVTSVLDEFEQSDFVTTFCYFFIAATGERGLASSDQSRSQSSMNSSAAGSSRRAIVQARHLGPAALVFPETDPAAAAKSRCPS
jgi:hypothetical protein